VCLLRRGGGGGRGVRDFVVPPIHKKSQISLIFGKKRSWWSLGVVLSLAGGQVSFGHGVATRGMSSA